MRTEQHDIGPNRRGEHRGVRRLVIVAVALVALVVIFRLVLDPIAAHFTRKSFEKVEGFKPTFSSVHVSVLPPGFEIRQFKVIEEPKGRWDEPLIYVERAKLGVYWRKLLEGQVVTRVLVQNPKFVAARRHEEKVEKVPTLAERMEPLLPAKVDVLEVVDGEVLIAEGKGKKAPKVWLNNVDLLATNLATRENLMEGLPSKLNMTARVQRSGRLQIEARIDPWAAKPTFTADAKLEKLDARELFAFLANKSEMHPKSGTINLFAKLEAKNGVLRGGVKPVIENLELEASKQDIGTRFKTFLADTALDILADDERPEGGDAVATTIPIRGTLNQPDVQILPTVLGVIRNAFVVGLAKGWNNVPPRTAQKEEGAVEQTVEALKTSEGPPEAQPKEGEEKPDKAARAKAQRQARKANRPARRDTRGQPDDEKADTESKTGAP